ncbi:hypothetical protein K6119_00605 [Paracrocinitomix mangrovi]|uniref:hypothetical protein n=1 Tax=Paracrocinitomix mangrovi TaxID=2862509 RepID=UPI001EDC16B8|nr:hypothetical protein [Paracrocinitomix mangrovi]UKN02015.1 hypothetical protein K6119_00605 [Paracrocinitomix mangrovi]
MVLRISISTLLFFIYSFSSAQDSFKDYYQYSIGNYVVLYPTIVKGRITKIKNKNALVEVTEWYKNELNLKDKIKISSNSYANYKGYTTLKNELGLELEREYIFVLATAPNSFLPEPLDAPQFRFIVENDSLFIPPDLIPKFENSTFKIQKNDFSDPIFDKGLKISLDYFKNLILKMNETFLWEKTKRGVFTKKRRMRIKCLQKLSIPDTNEVGLLRSVMLESLNLWNKNKCGKN